MADVRLVNRDTGSVVVVSEDKADRLLVSYNLERESGQKAPAKKTTAKKSSSSKSSK